MNFARGVLIFRLSTYEDKRRISEGRNFHRSSQHRSIQSRLLQLWEVQRCILLRRFFIPHFGVPCTCFVALVSGAIPISCNRVIYLPSTSRACIDEKRKMGSHVTSSCFFARPTMDVILHRVSHKRRVKGSPQRSCSLIFRFNLRFRFSVGWLLHRSNYKRIYVKTEK